MSAMFVLGTAFFLGGGVGNPGLKIVVAQTLGWIGGCQALGIVICL